MAEGRQHPWGLAGQLDPGGGHVLADRPGQQQPRAPPPRQAGADDVEGVAGTRAPNCCLTRPRRQCWRSLL
jgi:hypothetical protein